jgi:hypothetical protein
LIYLFRVDEGAPSAKSEELSETGFAEGQIKN